MAYLNSVHLIGNLGRDCSIAMTTTGRKCAKMALATSRKYKDNQGNLKEDTVWHNIVAWGKLADAMEKLIPRKGDALYVGGSISSRPYEVNGEKRTAYEIIADTIQLLSNKNQPIAHQANAPMDAAPHGYNPEEDLPF